jgi:hypothetical protein
MNSRDKGKRGEREFASVLRENGFDARRGQQFSGGPESPDIVSRVLGWLHIEVKRVERLNIIDACVQAEGDAKGKPWIIVHRRNHGPWLFTAKLEFFFDLLRGLWPPSWWDERKPISDVAGVSPDIAREERALAEETNNEQTNKTETRESYENQK